jgi:phenylpropionate dioxygenase-like ring-hydroxylating dioxygenase large terminal subunit
VAAELEHHAAWNQRWPLKTVVFAGFIFINIDPNPESFDEFIAPVRELIEGLAIGDIHHYCKRDYLGQVRTKLG